MLPDNVPIRPVMDWTEDLPNVAEIRDSSLCGDRLPQPCHSCHIAGRLLDGETHVDADIWMLDAAASIEALVAENATLRSRLDAIEAGMAEAREKAHVAGIALPAKAAHGFVNDWNDCVCVAENSLVAAAIAAALNLLDPDA